MGLGALYEDIKDEIGTATAFLAMRGQKRMARASRKQAAAQELLEETGHRAEKIELLGVIHPDTGRLTNRHWCFFASGLSRAQTTRAADEVAELVTMPLSEFQELLRSGGFNHAQHLATLQLAQIQGKLNFPAPSILASAAKTAAHSTAAQSTAVTSGNTAARADNVALEVCIVGGAGHVGLPLGLVLANIGMRVLIFDTNRATLDRVAGGEMPFMEDDAQPLLQKALAEDRLRFSTDPAELRSASVVIVTIGTPVDEFLNPDVGVIRRWLESVLPYITDDQLIILRSTLYPGTTNWLDNQFRAHGKQPRIAFCPERIVQGQAIKELPMLPQIVSGTTPEAEDAAAEFWSRIAPSVVRMEPMEAEFAKLICNAYRYVQFAVSNQLFMITTEAGVDFGRIVRGLKENYPRMRDFPSAGFAAGPCLLKDSMQLAAFAQNHYSLGHAAMQVNEGLVLWLVNELARKHDLSKMTIGLLGMAFKANIDDTRASLSYKLKKALLLRCRAVVTADPHVTTDAELLPTDEVVRQSDLLILCAPHREFRTLDLQGKPLIDIWGVRSADTGLLEK
jgi:UDP-N-acetyl-D-mannosaminuronic acid dehydrogenase